ncbi:MAG: sigma-70 family RNA polymerase sigma factor [Oscillospiraceae bacterium]|nr:sigma-70 family RNA polymerase sigma factor [Oscillospiraceae bacterium]
MEYSENCYRRFLDGDESAFTEIIAEHRGPVTFFIQRYVHDICAAEDIAADVFMELVVHPHKYRFGTPLRTYLLVLARSRAIDWLRREKHRQAVPLEDVAEQLADTKSLEDEVLRSERSRILHEAIGKLPPEQQAALHLVYFDEQSYADTAKILHITKKRVDHLLCRAKQSLRSIIGEDGVLN